MSYVPPPSAPPLNYGPGGPGANRLALARRASIPLFILGGLGLCCGLLLGGDAAALSADQLEMVAHAMALHIPDDLGMTVAQVMRMMLGIGAILVGVVGILSLVLAMLVRGGSRGAMIAGMIVQILVVGWLLLNMVTAAITGAALGALVALVVCVPVVLGIVWLAQALGAPKPNYPQPWPPAANFNAAPPGIKWPKEYGYRLPADYPQAPQNAQHTLGPIPPPEQPK